MSSIWIMVMAILNIKDSLTDGIDHINIYSKGQTELGRMLSNFYYLPFECEDGKFNSIEGYWYWIGNHDDRLRNEFGYAAKRLGKELGQKITITDEEFKLKIRIAINIKLLTEPLKTKLINSTLPFDHYYVFGGVVKSAGFKWIIKHIEEARSNLKHNESIQLTTQGYNNLKEALYSND